MGPDRNNFSYRLRSTLLNTAAWHRRPARGEASRTVLHSAVLTTGQRGRRLAPIQLIVYSESIYEIYALLSSNDADVLVRLSR